MAEEPWFAAVVTLVPRRGPRIMDGVHRAPAPRCPGIRPFRRSPAAEAGPPRQVVQPAQALSPGQAAPARPAPYTPRVRARARPDRRAQPAGPGPDDVRRPR